MINQADVIWLAVGRYFRVADGWNGRPQIGPPAPAAGAAFSARLAKPRRRPTEAALLLAKQLVRRVLDEVHLGAGRTRQGVNASFSLRWIWEMHNPAVWNFSY